MLFEITWNSFSFRASHFYWHELLFVSGCGHVHQHS